MPPGRKGAVAFLSPQRSLNPLNQCHTNQGSLAISFRSDISIRPMHLFGHNRDHDYYFELLFAEEWNAQSIARCSTSHHGDVRAVPRANRISQLARNSIPCASSKTDAPLVSWPWRLWRSCAHAAASSGCTYCATLESYGWQLVPLPLTRSAAENCPGW